MSKENPFGLVLVSPDCAWTRVQVIAQAELSTRILLLRSEWEPLFPRDQCSKYLGDTDQIGSCGAQTRLICLKSSLRSLFVLGSKLQEV